MISQHKIAPYKRQFEEANDIATTTIDDVDDKACILVGRFIRQWFIDNPSAPTLLLERDAAGVPTIKTGNRKELCGSFSQKWKML